MAPLVVELAGPRRRVVIPELLERFLEKVSSDGSQVVAEQIAEAEVLVIAEILTAFEQQPTRLLQDGLAPFAVQAASLRGADLVERLVHLRHDVEAVEDMERFRAPFADDLKIWLPHVGADECDLGDDFVAHGGEESLKGLDGSPFAHPEQTGDAEIDLLHQGQILCVLDFIHADGVDLTQCSVFQPPGDDVLDGIEHLIPGSSERLGCLFPGKVARPACQKQHVGFAQRAFAIAPRNLFDYDSVAAATVYPPHGVQKEDEKSPSGMNSKRRSAS
jgi:hypothetical protein